jgi:hypothetical protein
MVALIRGRYREIKERAPMLTAQQVERYRWDGYLFPLPALSPDELAAGNIVRTYQRSIRRLSPKLPSGCTRRVLPR